MRILVAGMVARDPHQGGAAWAVMQYVLGFRRLGNDVSLVESIAEPSADSVAYFHDKETFEARVEELYYRLSLGQATSTLDRYFDPDAFPAYGRDRKRFAKQVDKAITGDGAPSAAVFMAYAVPTIFAEWIVRTPDADSKNAKITADTAMRKRARRRHMVIKNHCWPSAMFNAKLF